jgi:hypothetical protein
MSRILLIVTVLSSATRIALNVFLAKLSIALVMLPDYESFCINRESYQGKQEKTPAHEMENIL